MFFMYLRFDISIQIFNLPVVLSRYLLTAHMFDRTEFILIKCYIYLLTEKN